MGNASLMKETDALDGPRDPTQREALPSNGPFPLAFKRRVRAL